MHRSQGKSPDNDCLPIQEEEPLEISEAPRRHAAAPVKVCPQGHTSKDSSTSGDTHACNSHVQHLCNKCYHILISHFVEEGVELKGEENSSSTSGLPRARVRNVSLPRLNASTYGGNQIHDRDHQKVRQTTEKQEFFSLVLSVQPIRIRGIAFILICNHALFIFIGGTRNNGDEADLRPPALL